jgi:hypothetical protein
MASYKNFVQDRVKNANVVDLSKKPKNQVKAKSKNEEFKERIIDWVTFYRRNIHRFVQHYFVGIDLHLYQMILLYLMNFCSLVVIVACRASAKSFIIAIYACAKSILYPNSRIVIASSTKKQSSLIVSEKIKKELIPNCPNLQREIKDIRTGQNETEVIFHNGSSIVVVPANENGRGFRATVIIYEEFRKIKKDIIDSVLSPFLISRNVPCYKKEEYSHLIEEPMEIYISSAGFKQEWMWGLIKLAVKSMYQTKDALLIGFDYAITLKHGIRTRKQLIKEKKKMDTTTFSIEYENLMLGISENAYFTYDLLNKAQKLKKAFYPRNHLDVIEKKKNKFDIPKQNGEIRIISVDIAMITNKQGKNDNTAITCIRALPNKDYYERQVAYIETFNGGNTGEQAVRIKEIFADFNADYVCLDTQNAGISVFDELGKVIYDDKRDVEYPAWTCFNDEDVASRIKNPNALPVVFSIKASERLNHEIHMAVKDCFERGKIKLLVSAIESKDYLETKKEYTNASIKEKAILERCYIQTDLMINEMINLSYEIRESTKLIKLIEPRNSTKDRYISLAYGNYFIKLLERDLVGEEDDIDEQLVFF